MMTQYKRFTTYSLHCFWNNKKRMIFCIFVLLISTLASFISQVNVYKNSDIVFSFADFLLQTGYPLIFYTNLVILPCFVISTFINFDFSVNSIIRYAISRSIYFKQCVLANIVSLIFVVYQFVITTIIGCNLTNVKINFSQKNSLFCFINQGRTSDVSLIKVFLLSFLFCFFSSLFFSLLYIIMKWLLHNDMAIFLFVIIFYILDYVCGIGVCNLFGVYYEKWFPYNWLNLIIILLMSIAIFLMGRFVSGRKEFLNAK